MTPSSVQDNTEHTISASAADHFTCDSCDQGNFTCITFVKPTGEKHNDGGGLGFDVCKDHTQRLLPAHDDGFYIRSIIAGGPADRDGRLKEGMTSRYFCTNLHSCIDVARCYETRSYYQR